MINLGAACEAIFISLSSSSEQFADGLFVLSGEEGTFDCVEDYVHGLLNVLLLLMLRALPSKGIVEVVRAHCAHIAQAHLRKQSLEPQKERLLTFSHEARWCLYGSVLRLRAHTHRGRERMVWRSSGVWNKICSKLFR